MEMQLTYCELRRKEVINIVDGRRLGHIIDVVFNICGQIQGFVTPAFKRKLFKQTDDIFVPWCDIKKIGEDVILVELRPKHHHRRNDSDCACDTSRDEPPISYKFENANNINNQANKNYNQGGSAFYYIYDQTKPTKQVPYFEQYNDSNDMN